MRVFLHFVQDRLRLLGMTLATLFSAACWLTCPNPAPEIVVERGINVNSGGVANKPDIRRGRASPRDAGYCDRTAPCPPNLYLPTGWPGANPVVLSIHYEGRSRLLFVALEETEDPGRRRLRGRNDGGEDFHFRHHLARRRAITGLQHEPGREAGNGPPARPPGRRHHGRWFPHCVAGRLRGRQGDFSRDPPARHRCAGASERA